MSEDGLFFSSYDNGWRDKKRGTNYLYNQLIVYISVVCLRRVNELAHLEYFKT
jgi:hypothetical protein